MISRVNENGPTGFWAVKFSNRPANEVLITRHRVSGPLAAYDDVFGTDYTTVLSPINVLFHNFNDVRCKMVARSPSELRSNRWRRAALEDPTGWEQPAYPAAIVRKVRAVYEKRLGGQS